jgi:Icc-related predicted phosphoesterase
MIDNPPERETKFTKSKSSLNLVSVGKNIFLMHVPPLNTILSAKFSKLSCSDMIRSNSEMTKYFSTALLFQNQFD